MKNYKVLIHDYFNISYRWDELDIAIDHFFLCEGEEKAKELLEEIKYIQKEVDMEYMKEINKFGGIYYDEERNKVFFERIIKYVCERLKIAELVLEWK